ncbi:MAG: hypothetical protein ABJ239_02440 [Erythrobacter sp.]
MSGDATYTVPTGPLRLAGPVVRPAPGTLPLRGDLAHIALAGRHLAAHYVIPYIYTVGPQAAALHLTQESDSEIVTHLEADSAFEVLDFSGDWAWGCLGPDGPSGYVKSNLLSPPKA